MTTMGDTASLTNSQVVQSRPSSRHGLKFDWPFVAKLDFNSCACAHFQHNFSHFRPAVVLEIVNGWFSRAEKQKKSKIPQTHFNSTSLQSPPGPLQTTCLQHFFVCPKTAPHDPHMPTHPLSHHFTVQTLFLANRKNLPPSRSTSAARDMAPELFTISTVPEYRLKVVIQANALFEALLAGVCFAASEKVGHLLALPAPTFAVLLGFSFAFASAFLFRTAMKQPLSSGYVVFIGVSNLFTAIAITIAVILDLFHFSKQGSVALYSVSAIHAALGLSQLLMHRHSRHTFQPPDVVAV